MADEKLSALTALTTLTGDDLFYAVDDPAGTPVQRKVTASVLRTYIDKRGGTIVRNDGSTTLSIAASTFTKLTPINSEEYDPNGWWDNSNQRFQPTRAGEYLIIAGSQITMAAAAGVVTSYLLVARKNGTDFAHLARGWISGGGNVGVSGTCLCYCNGSTDYVEPFGWQNDSVSRTTVAGAERQFFMAGFFSEV